MASREQISIVQSKFTSGETVVIVSFVYVYTYMLTLKIFKPFIYIFESLIHKLMFNNNNKDDGSVIDARMG